MSRESALRTRLEENGWPFAALIECHTALGSTNDRLKDLARRGAPEGALVLADVQASGRGRQGRSWVSPAGNLHLSVLLRPARAAAPLLPLAAGVAVAEGVAAFGVRARLKWPNDVMVGERKLGGILAESSTTGAALEWVVVGLGLNVGGELPPELRAQAISLREAGASVTDVDAVAASVLGLLAVWYHRLAEGGRSPVVSAWRERAVPWWGGRVVAFSEEGRLEGRAIDVDEEGGLILEMDDGTLKTLRSGEVSRARAAG